MQVLKSIFTKSENLKKPEIQSTFDHSKISSANDISQCPFMKNKQQTSNQVNQNNSKAKCPYQGSKSEQKGKINNTNQIDSSSDEEELPKSGCPFMGGSEKKKNPDLFQMSSGYNQPYISRFSYYLSPNKIDFNILQRKYNGLPISKSRQIFNTYPIYLQHTLFFAGQDYQKVRNVQCCSRFLPYQKLREKGNKLFNKKKYNEALDYYEKALSLFKWLQYSQEEKDMKSSRVSRMGSEASIDSDNCESQRQNININLKNSEEENFEERDEKFQDMKKKYKEFFVIYYDSNVKLCDGEQLEESADIDMRKSLMLQVYLNMAVTYIHLNHFELALKCIQDCFQLTNKVSQIYLRKAQALIFNKICTLEDAYEAKNCMQKAIQIKKTEKIFQSNENILKIINLHKADDAYHNTLNYINEKIEEKQKQIKKIQQKIYNRAKEIHEIEQKMINQGKKPYQRNQQPMISSREYKILLKMRQKYLKVIEFYAQSQKQDQIILANNQFQQLLRILYQIHQILNIQIKQQSNELGGLASSKIQNRLSTIKKNQCDDIYNKGKFNFSVLEWAVKEVFREEKELKQIAKENEEKCKIGNAQEKSGEKNKFLKKMSWGLVALPILAIIVNSFLI